MDNTSKDEKLYMRRVKHAIAYYRVTLFANLLNSLIVIYILRGVVPHSRLAIWFAALAAIVIARFIHVHYAPSETYSQTKKIERINFFGLLLTGTAWGMIPLFLFPENSLAHQTFIAFAIGGMIAGACVTSAALSYFFLAFSIPSMIPLIYRFIEIGMESTHAMALMLTVFFFSFAYISTRLQSLIIDTIQSTLEKEEEIEIRKTAEKELRKHKDSLELIVEERTEELIKSNRLLVDEIAERKQSEGEREKLIDKLQSALDEIKTLRGIIPICTHCKKIRNDQGAWDILESYIAEHTDAHFSHGLCPDCYEKEMEEIDKDE